MAKRNMANILEVANHRAKASKIWNSEVLVQHPHIGCLCTAARKCHVKIFFISSG